MTDDNPKNTSRLHTTTRRPDYEFHSVTHRNGVDEWRIEGGAWKHKSGCITAIFGEHKFVFSPVENEPPLIAEIPPQSSPPVVMQGNPELVH